MWNFLWTFPSEHTIVFIVILCVLVLLAGQDDPPNEDFNGGP